MTHLENILTLGKGVPEILSLFCAFLTSIIGLKINLHKSEVTCFGTAVDRQDIYAHIFTCNVGSRLVLIEVALSNVPSYMLSFLRIPVGVTRRFDYYFFRARMLWQVKQGVKQYHLVRWPDVFQPREQEGLGFTGLQIKNISLLCK